MGLLQRKDDSASHYIAGSAELKLIIGLGNIGPKYDQTRHNVGFMVVDKLAEQHSLQWREKPNLHTHLAEVHLGSTKMILAKPDTLMNRSGKAVLHLCDYFKISPDQILVVHDELDLGFGAIRYRQGGGTAGHNGIASITQVIGEDYGRLRLGIHNQTADRADGASFVLNRFNSEERAGLPAIIQTASEMAEQFALDQLEPHTVWAVPPATSE